MGRKAKRKQQEEKKQKPKQLWYPIAFLDNKTNWLSALLIFLPIIYSSKTADPALAGRYMFLGYFVGAFVVYHYLIRNSKLVWPLPKLVIWFLGLSTAFFLWCCFATFSAVNMGEAVYETSRYGLNLILLFIVIQSVLDPRFNFNQLFRAILLVAFIHGFIGIDQKLEWGVTDIPGTAGPYGLMINRNLYGSFMMYFIPLVWYYAITQKGFWRVASLVTFVVVLVANYYADTRAAWLSAAVLSIIFISIITFKFPEYRKSLLSMFFVGAVILGSLVIYKSVFQNKAKALTYQEQRDTTQLLFQEAVQNVTQEKDGNKKTSNNKNKQRKRNETKHTLFGYKIDGSIHERVTVWRESQGLIRDNIIDGVGPGNWKVVIPKYRIGGIRNDYGKIIRIRPHNILIQVMSETGLVGFILFYSTMIIALILGLKVVFGKAEGPTRIMILAMVCTLIGFAIDGQFSFPTERHEHSLILFLITGLIVGTYALQLPVQKESFKNSQIPRIVGLGLLIVVGWNIFLADQRFTFDNHIRRAKILVDKKQNERALREVELGKSKWVSVDLSAEPLEMIAAVSLHNLKKYEAALKEILQAEKYNPHSTRINNTKGTIYTNLKQYDKAIDAYVEGLKYSPKYDVSLKNLALNYYYSEQYENCIETFKQIDLSNDERFRKVLRSAEIKLERKKAEMEKEKQSNTEG